MKIVSRYFPLKGLSDENANVEIIESAVPEFNNGAIFSLLFKKELLTTFFRFFVLICALFRVICSTLIDFFDTINTHFLFISLLLTVLIDYGLAVAAVNVLIKSVH